MRIGCLGMATLDTLLFTPKVAFADETVTPVEEAVLSTGGKGMVTAIAMAESGADVVPLALLGRDSRLAELLPAGIEDRYLLPRLTADNRTWITVSEGHKVVTFISRGTLEGASQIAAAVESFVSELDALYLTIEEVAVLRAALDATAGLDIPIAINASLPLLDALGDEHVALLAELVGRSRIILCNDWEAPHLLRTLGVGGWSDLDSGILEEVVVTAGPAGGQYALPPFREWERFEATPVSDLRCVVGAGDTFSGGYLTARLVAGATPAESCRRGADLAALKVAHRGSVLPLSRLQARS